MAGLSMWTIGWRRETRMPHSTSSQPQPTKPASNGSASNTSRRISRLEVKTYFSGRLAARLGRQAVAAQRHAPGARRWRGCAGAWSSEKPPKATAGSSAVDQLQPAARKSGASGSMSASRNSRWRAARVGGQPVAALGAALVGGEPDEAGRAAQRLHGARRRARPAASSPEPSSSTTISTPPRPAAVERRAAAGAGIVAEERDQHREPRRGAGPGGVVDDPSAAAVMRPSVRGAAPSAAGRERATPPTSSAQAAERRRPRRRRRP